MEKIFSFLLALILLIENLPLAFVPTLKIDASKTSDSVSTRATGFLYGLAQPGVPSEAMTNSLDISSVSQKVIGGLQHPTGDVDNVASQLCECDYTVVYLQDAFDTWYYAADEIMQMRKDGTYDFEQYIKTVYFPIVKEQVSLLKEKSYADDLVYCIYNECDNGVWFGNYVDGNAVYDEVGRENFYKAWKMTYDLVKSIDPNAKIGGPGFCDYETSKTEGFMSFCAKNNCVPEIMIYHELSYWSIPDWQTHVDDYRRIEKENGIAALPIIVTEYGTMEDCGNCARMIHYICAIENSGTYGNMAFWRLANNLNDTCSDDNTPNSNWWLYRKYAQMDGSLLKVSTNTLPKKLMYDNDSRLKYTGLASINDEKTQIDIIASSSKNQRAVQISNLGKTNLGKEVDVKVECVYYSGLNSAVYEPIVLRQYTAKTNGTLNINIPGTDTDAVYFVTVTAHTDEIETIRNTDIPVRYEFEKGKLLGNAYTYDSAYATTGEEKGMVGGIENDGDGVKLDIYAKEDGVYNLDIVYGKHNDSSTPDGRDFAKANLKIDSNEQTLVLSNTIKSEYTNLYTVTVELSKGKHTLEFTHNSGTYVLDSLILSKKTEKENISVLPDGENCFLAVAPKDGYYKLCNLENAQTAYIDNIKTEVSNGSVVYLRRGLNEIATENATKLEIKKTDESAYTQKIEASEFSVSSPAQKVTDKYGNTYVDNISSLSGEAQFKVNVEKGGEYRVTLTYANNDEGGVHSYNVDLIERYVTVTSPLETKDVFCRNTFSKYNFKTMTFTLKLNEGENIVTLSNSGNYIFNGKPSFAPQIASVTVNEVCA